MLSLNHASLRQRSATILCAAAFLVVCPLVRTQTQDIRLTPAFVEVGAPELIRVEAPGAMKIDGEWLARKLQFFRGREGQVWFALAGADVEAPVGPSQMKITVSLDQGSIYDLTRTVEVHPAAYRTESITVSPRFVEPDPDALKQIEAESKLKEAIFSESAAEPLWNSTFRAPVVARATDSYGVRRMFNGKLASIHKGMDFRAPTGTPVRASNGGVVVLARPLYYEGNCVIIDHGMGLFTLSMHLSRIDVQEGQRVAAGERIGLSGATGRVTGPHLHWAVRWEGAYLDPAKLLKLDLDAVR
jgi:murein DD-endopeptidase MepM/ murein hydrolase activator NlpD